MNLIIELPKREEGKEAGARMKKHFSRVQKMASVANKVYILAPKANGYWHEWRSWFDEHRGTYKPTHHHWCGLGIRDGDTGKPLNHLTLMYTNDHAIPSHHCRCDGVQPHTKDLRQVRNEDEIARYAKSPYQKSNSEWASKILELLKLSPGGPYLTSDESVRYGADSKHSEGKVRKTSRKAKGSDDQAPAVGGACGASHAGTNGATFTIANQNSTTNQNFPTTAKEKEKQKDADNKIRGIEKQNLRVIIEQVSAMPGQGVTSMFNFGQSFGILKGICSAMQLPMYFVRPAKWKKYFGLIKSEKDASRTKAIEMFPYFSSQLSKKKDSNKADAILIASFYYETYKFEE